MMVWLNQSRNNMNKNLRLRSKPEWKPDMGLRSQEAPHYIRLPIRTVGMQYYWHNRTHST